MLGQASLLNEESSLSLQFETDQAALSQDAASRRSPWFLWTAIGSAVLMLIGVSACASLPLASRNLRIQQVSGILCASGKPARDAPAIAFNPGIRSAITGRRPAAVRHITDRRRHRHPIVLRMRVDTPVRPATRPLPHGKADSGWFKFGMSSHAEFRQPERLLDDYSGVMSLESNVFQDPGDRMSLEFSSTTESPGKMCGISRWYQIAKGQFENDNEYEEEEMTDAKLHADKLDGRLDKAERIYIGSSLPLEEHGHVETNSLHPIFMEFWRPQGGWDARYLFDCVEKVDSVQRPMSNWLGDVDRHHTYFEGLEFDEQKGAYFAMWGSMSHEQLDELAQDSGAWKVFVRR